jgi:phosphoribosyl 1,2-cyclic phosphodiesterase/CheY-like chemotaxis protein
MNESAAARVTPRKKILLIDDDRGLLSIRKLRLLVEGYDVKELNDSSLAMETMAAFNPDLVVLDLIMPKMSGEVVLERIRSDQRYQSVKIVVNSAKKFESDYRSCLESGADAYLSKPLEHDTLTGTIRKLLHEEVTVCFWGTRGSIARPGQDTLKYGGNTPCVSLEMSKDRSFVFDAGTGIVSLGRALAARNSGGHHKFNLFISHPHWDHIQGLPFFEPLYRQGNEMVVHGTGHGKLSLREVISGQMNNLYFPVTIKEYASRVYFVELVEGDYEIEGLQVSTIGLNHPGLTLGYRVTSETGKTVAYITDNEIYPDGDQHNRDRLVAFVKNVDVLIHDTAYFDEEYPARAGWGHSALSEVLKLAADARAKSLYLFHHDPAHDDEAVERKEAIGRRYFEQRRLDIQCSAAREGAAVTI